MAGAGTLAVYLTGNASRFNRTMAGAQRTLSNFTGSIRGMGGMLAGALGGAGIALSLKSSVAAYMEQEAVLAKLGAVLKSTGYAAGFSTKQMYENAKALGQLTTYGTGAINNVQMLLATFTQIKGDIFKEATGAVLDISQVLGQDAASGAIQLGKALNDPIRGVTALRRVGVSFSAEQLKQIQNFVKAGKLVDAQRLILAELKTEFGGAAEAYAKTAAGRLEMVKKGFKGVQQQIGYILVEGLKLPELMGTLKGKLDEIKKWFESGAPMKWFIETKFVFLKIGAVLAVFGENIGTQIDWIGENWGKLWENALDLAIAFGKDFVSLWWRLSTFPIQMMKKAMGGAGGALRPMQDLLDNIKDNFAYLKGEIEYSEVLAREEKRQKSYGNTGSIVQDSVNLLTDTLVDIAKDVGINTEAALKKTGATELNLQGYDEVLERFSELDKKRIAELAAMSPAFAKLLTDAVGKAPPIPFVEPIAGPERFAAAVEKGSLDAYKAEIGKSSVEMDMLKVSQQQLAVQREQLAAQKAANSDAGGDYELAEVGV